MILAIVVIFQNIQMSAQFGEKYFRKEEFFGNSELLAKETVRTRLECSAFCNSNSSCDAYGLKKSIESLECELFHIIDKPPTFIALITKEQDKLWIARNDKLSKSIFLFTLLNCK